MTETASTPFLPPSTDTPLAFPPANPPATRTVVRLTRSSFYTSLITFVFILADYIALSIAPLFTWRMQSDLGALTFFLAFTALLSLFNLSTLSSGPPPHTTPLLLNLIGDLLLTFGVLTACFRLLFDATVELRIPPHCGYDYGKPGDDPPPVCWGWFSVVVALGSGCFLGGLVVGISHLALLIIRGINTSRSRFWSRPFPWFVPAGGHMAIEFNIRVVRSDTSSEVPAGDRAIGGQSVAGRIEGSGEVQEEEDERLVEV